MSALIEFRDVCKTYPIGACRSVTALEHVSFRIEAGEAVSIVGSNGSGKTSLLMCAAGTLMPDSGEVDIGGTNVASLRPAERGRLIGMVFQNPGRGTASYLTIEENLAMGVMRGRRPGVRRLFSADVRGRIDEALRRLAGELQGRARQRAGTLSGGQRQGVALLTAVLGSPRILLLDEHTASLDPSATKVVLGLTNDLARQHDLTILAVTHSLQQALDFGGRLLVMHRGLIVLDVSGHAKQSLTPERLYSQLQTVSAGDIASQAAVTVDAAIRRQPEGRQ